MYLSAKNLFHECNVSSMSFMRAQVYKHHLCVHTVCIVNKVRQCLHTQVLPVVL